MDLAERLSALEGEGLTDRTLRTAQLDLIAARLGFDGHVFAMTDPSTGIVTSPHATVPMVAQSDLPGLIRRRYAAAGMAEWGAVLTEFGVTDAMSVKLDDQWGTWGFLELWRCSGTFSHDERGRLAALGPVLTPSLRMSVARTFMVLDARPPGLESGVVLVDDGLEVRSVTSGAAEALMRLLPPTEPGPPVPAAAYNVVAALLAHEDGIWPGEPWARVHLGPNRWATVRAERLDDRVAVSIGPSTAAERADLFARANQFSRRETEVLHLALHGMDTRAIADELVIAHSTTEDHLKALLAKTGCASRHQLLARALGG
ncbi:MAG TPA: helix-turn-helix transcriptional regulator [Nocardioides sp.]|nr:helix-turn-helix transcriptional regulator [Nocardioides sp.]